MKRLTITLKPKHQEELERLQQTLGGVSPSVAIAFLVQTFAPKAIGLIAGSSNLQQNADLFHLQAPISTNQHLQTSIGADSHLSAPTSTNQHQSAPIISESEAALNALMESFG